VANEQAPRHKRLASIVATGKTIDEHLTVDFMKILCRDTVQLWDALAPIIIAIGGVSPNVTMAIAICSTLCQGALSLFGYPDALQRLIQALSEASTQIPDLGNPAIARIQSALVANMERGRTRLEVANEDTSDELDGSPAIELSRTRLEGANEDTSDELDGGSHGHTVWHALAAIVKAIGGVLARGMKAGAVQIAICFVVCKCALSLFGYPDFLYHLITVLLGGFLLWFWQDLSLMNT
jgi:hypothetical protein